MLKKENRLKNRVAFSATYKQHRSFADELLILYVGRKKEHDEHIKFGFVVSKKISKRAVKRNKIKRLMRENIRLYLKNYPEPNFKSMVFVAKQAAVDKNFAQIEKSTKFLLEKSAKI